MLGGGCCAAGKSADMLSGMTSQRLRLLYVLAACAFADRTVGCAKGFFDAPRLHPPGVAETPLRLASLSSSPRTCAARFGLCRGSAASLAEADPKPISAS